MVLDPNLLWVLLGTTLLGASLGLAGAFSFLRKTSLSADVVAHAVLPGICGAFLLTEDKSSPYMFVGAIVSGLLALRVITTLLHRTKLKADPSQAVTLAAFFGAGLFVLSIIQHLPIGSQSGLDRFLFGNAAAIQDTDLYLAAGWTLGVLLAVWLLFKEWQLLTFDHNYATAIGRPVPLLNWLLDAILVGSIVISLQATGVVLVSGLLMLPAAVARRWTSSFGWLLTVSTAVGALIGVGGAYSSVLLGGVPTGAAIIIVAVLLLLLSVVFAPKSGAVAQWWQRRQQGKRIASENMLKALYKCWEQSDKSSGRWVSPAQLTRFTAQDGKLASQTAQHLAHMGWLDRSGALLALTDTGLSEAKRITRAHRMYELYLSHFMRLPSDHVHDAAESIEHLLTPELEALITQALDDPSADPHGTEIPGV